MKIYEYLKDEKKKAESSIHCFLSLEPQMLLPNSPFFWVLFSFTIVSWLAFSPPPLGNGVCCFCGTETDRLEIVAKQTHSLASQPQSRFSL